MQLRNTHPLFLLFGSLIGVCLAQSGRAMAQEVESTFSQPASLSRVMAILPNGREIRPMGTWVPLAPYPFAIAVRPDGEEVAIPSIGFPFALNIIEHPDGPQPTAKRMPATAAKTPGIQTHA